MHINSLTAATRESLPSIQMARRSDSAAIRDAADAFVHAPNQEAASDAYTRLRGLQAFGEKGMAELERRKSGDLPIPRSSLTASLAFEGLMLAGIATLVVAAFVALS